MSTTLKIIDLSKTEKISTTTPSSVLKNPTDAKVMELLLQKGPMTRAHIMKETNIARSTIYDSLVRLIIKGKVMKFSERLNRPGRPKVFFQVTE